MVGCVLYHGCCQEGKGPLLGPMGAQRWESMMAELDMSWTTEYQVVEDPYKGEDARDFEGFAL